MKEFMIDVLKASFGISVNIGLVFDALLFNNKSQICTLVSSLASGNFKYTAIRGYEMNDLSRRALISDFRQVFEVMIHKSEFGRAEEFIKN